MANSDRTEPLLMIGPKGLSRVVNSLRVIAPELPFKIEFIELTENEQHIEACGYHIDAFKVNHKITCYGYSISIPRAGLFDVEKAKANDVPLKLWNRLQKGESIELDGRVYEPSLVLGEPRKGLKVTYTTDTRPTDSIRKNAKNSDIFICEGMYGEQGDINNAVKYKHMTFEEAAGLARDAEVRELWLTHYSPAINHPEIFMENVRKIFANAHAAKDRRSAELNFEE